MTREEQLKQAIDELFPCHPSDVTGHYQRQVQRRLGANIMLSTPSILRHADPEIMKKAGWVREEELCINECIVCGKDFIGKPPLMCCSGKDCGCAGMPIDPVVCSDNCYDNLINKKNITKST